MEQALIVKFVDEIRLKMPRLGTRKLLHELEKPLAEHRISIGRDKLFDLLSEFGMLIRTRKRKVRTTFSDHNLRKYPNLITNLVPDSAEQIWVSNITYITVAEGFNYLSLITDAYSHKIVGWCLWDNLTAEGPLQALEMALTGRVKKHQVLIHHSDRGAQYCSSEYVNKLTLHGIFISMTEKGDPRENAIAERVNGILKMAFSLRKSFPDRERALQATEVGINTYNNDRPHLSCDYQKPAQAHNETGQLRKHWKNYYPQKEKEVEMK